MDMAIGMLIAKKPVMLGIKSLKAAAHINSTMTTNMGRVENAGTFATIPFAIHSPAPLLMSALAKDRDVANTKKLDQPNRVSNSFQVSVPMPGARRHTQAISAGNAGFR